MKWTPGSANLEIQGRMLKSLHSTLQLGSFRKLINFLLTHFLPCLARQAIIFIFNEIFWTCHHIALSSRSSEGDAQRFLPKGDFTRMNPVMLWPSDLSWHNGFCTRQPSHQCNDSLQICVIHSFLLIGLHHASWDGWINLAWTRCVTHRSRFIHSAA